MSEKLFYLASPYTRYPMGLDAAYRHVCQEAGVLMRAGVNLYSPIAHSHPISIHGRIDPLQWEFWMRQCRLILPRMDGLIQLKLPSWDISKGMAEEVRLMRELGKPVIPMLPGSVPKSLTKAPGSPSDALAG